MSKAADTSTITRSLINPNCKLPLGFTIENIASENYPDFLKASESLFRKQQPCIIASANQSKQAITASMDAEDWGAEKQMISRTLN